MLARNCGASAGTGCKMKTKPLARPWGLKEARPQNGAAVPSAERSLWSRTDAETGCSCIEESCGVSQGDDWEQQARGTFCQRKLKSFRTESAQVSEPPRDAVHTSPLMRRVRPAGKALLGQGVKINPGEETRKTWLNTTYGVQFMSKVFLILDSFSLTLLACLSVGPPLPSLSPHSPHLSLLPIASRPSFLSFLFCTLSSLLSPSLSLSSLLLWFKK